MVQARVRRNDALILAAAVDLTANRGWSGLTLAGAGKEAGLTIRPVRDRFNSKASLGARAWGELAGPALTDVFAQALGAAGLLDDAADPDSFATAMEALARPSQRLSAAAEIMIVACFEPEIDEAVRTSVGATVRGWLDPAQAGSPARAAKRGYLVALGLGLLATAGRPVLPRMDLATQWRRLLTTLATERDPVPLPDEPRPPHIAFIPFDTGDATTDDLLRAAIDHLGKHGYEGSILSAVATDADVSEATIYLRYPSKEAFFMDAINRHQDISIPGYRAHLSRLEEAYGTGIAEAISIRAAMHPSERLISVIEMERARLTWHRPNLAAADEDRIQRLAEQVLAIDPGNLDFADPARLHLARAIGIGVNFLPLVDEQAWDLPYDVVTIPLNEDAAIDSSD
jgi:AcrR family transcriptional regulator